MTGFWGPLSSVEMPRVPATKRKTRPAPLGDGLFAATVELVSPRSIRVKLANGQRVTAVLDDTVEPALVEECMRERRMVVVCDSPRGPQVIGALQTARAVAPDAQGTLTLHAKDLHLVAERSVVLEAGSALLRLERAGIVKTEGERMTIDMASFLRVFAHRVDLP